MYDRVQSYTQLLLLIMNRFSMKKTDTQTTFYGLKYEKRQQLYRAYYELVMYVPWENTQDKMFLSNEVQAVLNSKDLHAEIDDRHLSLIHISEPTRPY